MLFRYSALTFNGHRIHYDRDYARTEEGYADLVVHGPLIATLLADHMLRHRPRASLSSFSFRSLSPLTDIAPFTLCMDEGEDEISLWSRDQSGVVTMEARAAFAKG
jgi:3-methylfumaryl-CoA hydratase